MLATGCVIASQPDPSASSETQDLTTTSAASTPARSVVQTQRPAFGINGVPWVPLRPRTLSTVPGTNTGDPSATGDGTGDDPHPSPWHGDITSGTAADEGDGCDPHPSPWNPRRNVAPAQ